MCNDRTVDHVKEREVLALQQEVEDLRKALHESEQRAMVQNIDAPAKPVGVLQKLKSYLYWRIPQCLSFLAPLFA